MDALDPFDMYELLDVMDWWGTGTSRSSCDNASPLEAGARTAHEASEMK